MNPNNPILQALGLGGGAPASVQRGAGNPLGFSDNTLASGGWEEPTVEEPITSQNLMSGNPQKSEAMQRALKYKRLNWAPDNTIDQSIWDQINPPAQSKLGEVTTAPNSPGTTPPPSANIPQQATGSAQSQGKGPLQHLLGNMKKGWGEAGKKVGSYMSEWEKNLQEAGVAGFEKPGGLSVSDTLKEREGWFDPQAGMQFAQDATEQDVLNASYKVDESTGQKVFDPELYQENLTRYKSRAENPVYKQAQKDFGDMNYKVGAAMGGPTNPLSPIYGAWNRWTKGDSVPGWSKGDRK